MPAFYPSGVKTFTTKQDGVDYPQASHINELQDEVTAIERGLLEGLEHDLFPKVNTGKSLGTSAKAWDRVYANVFVSSVATGTPPMNVSSTTLVTSFNADFVDGRHATQLSTQRRTITLVVPGDPAAGSLVSARIIVPVRGTITAVRSTCRVAPTSGTYTYDVMRNGTTIYTTAANRPTRTSADGTGPKTHAMPDVTTFAAGDVFDITLVSAGSGIRDAAFFIEFDETGQ